MFTYIRDYSTTLHHSSASSNTLPRLMCQSCKGRLKGKKYQRQHRMTVKISSKGKINRGWATE